MQARITGIPFWLEAAAEITLHSAARLRIPAGANNAQAAFCRLRSLSLFIWAVATPLARDSSPRAGT